MGNQQITNAVIEQYKWSVIDFLTVKMGLKVHEVIVKYTFSFSNHQCIPTG